MVQGHCDTPDGGSLSRIIQSPADEEIHAALGSWLLTVVPVGYQVIQGQTNRWAPPPGDFLIFTPLMRRRIATNAWSYTDTTREVVEPVECTVQLSAFGETSGNAVQRCVALWRDVYAADWFRANVGILAPLYATEPRQSAFINASKQYEDNWTADIRFQVNFTLSVPQQFADTIIRDIREVDANFTTQE